jgi:hypothetical protein
MYYPTYGENQYTPFKDAGDFGSCCCFTAEDIVEAQTCPGGGGPAVKQCVQVGDGYLTRIACPGGDPLNYDFFLDPTDGPGGTPVCQGPNDPAPVQITQEKYDELFAILVAECPAFAP